MQKVRLVSELGKFAYRRDFIKGIIAETSSDIKDNEDECVASISKC